MFELRESEAVETDLNDFQHKIERLIKHHKDDVDFLLLEDFKITGDELDDYLFERQSILDSRGTERSRYTVAGILIVLPILVVSCFPEYELPWGKWSVLVAVAMGVVLFLLYLGIKTAIIKARLARLNRRRPDANRYVEALLVKYEE